MVQEELVFIFGHMFLTQRDACAVICLLLNIFCEISLVYTSQYRHWDKSGIGATMCVLRLNKNEQKKGPEPMYTWSKYPVSDNGKLDTSNKHTSKF